MNVQARELTARSSAVPRRCATESALSGELLSRLAAYPKLRAVLTTLSPKMLLCSSNRPAVHVEFSMDALETRVDDVVARICSSTFTGKGDMEKVPRMYKVCAARSSRRVAAHAWGAVHA
eukprot:3087582-Prymnesium_polylepis.1